MAIANCVTNIDKTGLELIEHGTSDFPIACYHDDLYDQAVNWHWHEEIEFIYVSEGSSVIAVDNERIIVHKGDGFFINTGVLHGCWDYQDSHCRYHSIVFHPRLVGGDENSVFWTKYIHPILHSMITKSMFLNHLIPWQQTILSSIDAAWHLCEKEPAGYEFAVRNALSELIYQLAHHLEEKNNTIPDAKIRNSIRMKHMLQFVHTHYSEAITMKNIAESASISESECLRCFRNTIETTPIQYLKSYRIKNAARLLTNTDEKIIDIGFRCGFQDMSYFAKSFREIYGCSPSEYRKNLPRPKS